MWVGGRQVLRLTNKSKWVEETDLVDEFMQDSLTVDCMQGCLRGG